MILVDSSVWIDFFAKRTTPHTDVLRALVLAEREALTADLVLTEVLQGARDDRHAATILAQLSEFDMVTIVDREVAIQAARHYRLLRSRGITVRKTIDTLIATRCIVDDILLLYADRDFDPFVKHLGLRSVFAPSGVS